MNVLETQPPAHSPSQSPPPQLSAEPESFPASPTLNDEVSQAMKQIGSFWGAFRKQSQNALETARKDLSSVVAQAQKEFGKIAALDPEPQSQIAPTPPAADAAGPSATANTTEGAQDRALPALDTTQTEGAAAHPPLASPSSTSFFDSIKSAIPPNIVETVQRTAGTAYTQTTAAFGTASTQVSTHARSASTSMSSRVDLEKLRKNTGDFFSSIDLETVRKNTGEYVSSIDLEKIKQTTGEYVQKSEGFFREAVKEAGEVLSDAFKVMPPDPNMRSIGDGFGGFGGSGMVWDGTDMWMLPVPEEAVLGPADAKAPKATASGSGKGKARAGAEAQKLATRAHALMGQLRRDPAILRHDPEAEGAAKALYTKWAEAQNADKANWDGKIKAALEIPGEGSALKATHDLLVPTEMAEDSFWMRYFFRVHQIETEEQKRKALLETKVEEEDFSWEDDEEAPSSSKPSASNKGLVPSQTQVKAQQSTETLTPANKDKLADQPADKSAAATETATRSLSEESLEHLSSGSGYTSAVISASELENKDEEEEEEDDEEEEEDDDEEEEETDEEEEEDEEEAKPAAAAAKKPEVKPAAPKVQPSKAAKQDDDEDSDWE